MILRHFLWILLLTICYLTNVFAMRCGDKIVYEGDSKFTVKAKCGEPLDVEVEDQPIPIYNGAGAQIGVSASTIERWIYQKSSAEFQYELIFDGGELKKINANRNP